MPFAAPRITLILALSLVGSCVSGPRVDDNDRAAIRAIACDGTPAAVQSIHSGSTDYTTGGTEKAAQVECRLANLGPGVRGDSADNCYRRDGRWSCREGLTTLRVRLFGSHENEVPTNRQDAPVALAAARCVSERVLQDRSIIKGNEPGSLSIVDVDVRPDGAATVQLFYPNTCAFVDVVPRCQAAPSEKVIAAVRYEGICLEETASPR